MDRGFGAIRAGQGSCASLAKPLAQSDSWLLDVVVCHAGQGQSDQRQHRNNHPVHWHGHASRDIFADNKIDRRKQHDAVDKIDAVSQFAEPVRRRQREQAEHISAAGNHAEGSDQGDTRRNDEPLQRRF